MNTKKEGLSISFLKRFHPGRPWILTAIAPDQKKKIETRAFPPGLSQGDDAAAFIAKWNEKRNLYFSVAEVIDAQDKKADRENIEAVHWLHVDIDAGAGDLLEELGRIKHLVTDKLPPSIPKPTCVVYSGGGYQAFWQLKEPIPIHGNVEAAEQIARYNKQLEVVFGGDHCHDISRIMRLPGTLNIPSARKVAKGRVPVEAKVLSFTRSSYDIGSFTMAADVGTGAGSQDVVEVSGNVARLTSVDDLDQWNVTDRLKVIIVQGHDPDNPKDGDNSRSAWLFDAVCNLVRLGVDDDVIYSVITDPDFKIAESVLEASNPEYAKKQIKSAHEAVEEPELAELNADYAVIRNLGGRCRVVCEVYNEALERDVLARFTFEDFRNQYLNREVMVPNGTNKGGNPKTKPEKLGKWWLEHRRRRQYEKVVFLPGRDVPGAYNMWQGFAHKPEEGEMHRGYLDHLLNNVCLGNREHFEYLLNWMSHVVQFPDRRIGIAVILRGRQGTGKSFFATHYGSLFGRHFYHVTNPKHVVGNFNSHLRDVLVLFADECFVPGNKEHASALKALVTERTITIEAKGIDAEPAANFVNVIMASNDDWVAEVEADDRRLFIVDISDERARDTKYFGTIANDLKRGGYSHLVHFLLHRDLSGFDPQLQLPETRAKDDQKNLRALRSEGVATEYRFLRDGGPLPDGSFVTDTGQLWIGTSALSQHLGVTPEKAGRFMRLVGGTAHRASITDQDGNASRSTGYLFQRDLGIYQERWKDLHLDRVAIQWPRNSHWEIEWPNDPEPPF